MVQVLPVLPDGERPPNANATFSDDGAAVMNAPKPALAETTAVEGRQHIPRPARSKQWLHWATVTSAYLFTFWARVAPSGIVDGLKVRSVEHGRAVWPWPDTHVFVRTSSMFPIPSLVPLVLSTSTFMSSFKFPLGPLLAHGACERSRSLAWLSHWWGKSCSALPPQSCTFTLVACWWVSAWLPRFWAS